MRPPWIARGWGLLPALLLGGCSALPWLPLAMPEDRTEVSPPGEDGTRYVMVEGGRLTSPRTLERRWKSTVHHTCKGEHMELSAGSYTRRQGGVIRRRVHEGYVRCLLDEGSEPGASPQAPTAADATAEAPSRSPRGRRGLRARTRPAGRG